jgi:hypothetical protein
MKSELERSDKLGRRVRRGPASSLGTSTHDLVLAALHEGDSETAEDYVRYSVEEAGRVLALFSTWIDAMLAFGRAEVDGFEHELARLEQVIGEPPPVLDDPDEVGRAEAERAAAAAHALDRDALEDALARLKEAGLAVHDAQADWCWGLLTVFRDSLGEERMEETLRVTQEPWLRERYARFAEMTPQESLELTIEGMRGHFTGPGRAGTVDVRDEENRWVLSFDACGSGGRMRRGDPARGQTPRTEAPYDFGVTHEAHDWSWGEEGVCLYCAHCAVVNEILPIEATGAPMRVVDYPSDPAEPCRWTIYKSPDLVPDEAYDRVGKARPAARRSDQNLES